MARMREPSLEAVEAALYDDRTLVRIHGMRRTLWVLPVELAAIVQAACTDAIAVRERRRLEKLLADSGIPDGSGWIDEVARATLEVLEARGERLRAPSSRERSLASALRSTTAPGSGRGEQPATSRVLFQLAAERRIARGRPRGSWTSSQYRWAPFESWLPGGLAEWPIEAAQAELARRWLAAFGPATVADVKWWTGWTLGETRRALAATDSVEVELDGGRPGLVLADDLEPVAAPDPWVALLPGLDPTAMGWKERDWYLGEHGPLLFDTQRERRPDRLVERTHRGRLGTAEGRRGRLPTARGHRLGRGRRRRRGRGDLDRAARRDARDHALPDAAVPGAERVATQKSCICHEKGI